MKITEYESMGLKEVPLQTAESTTEFVAKWGEEVAIGLLNDQIVYYKSLPALRRWTSEYIGEQTGVARLTKPGANKADGTAGRDVPAETEVQHIERALAESGKEITEFEAAIYVKAQEIAYDPVGVPRQARNKKVGKTYMAVAQSLFDEGKSAKAIKKLGLTPDATVEQLGAAIEQSEKARAAKMAAEYS